MKTTSVLVFLLCVFESIQASAIAQTTFGPRQTSIVGSSSVKTAKSKCSTIRYFSLKKFSSISPGLLKLHDLQLTETGLLIKQYQGWYIIQDSRAFSEHGIKQGLEKVKPLIADAYIVGC